MPDEQCGDRARRSWRGPRAHRLVVTTGGTGLTPRDVTPQATAAVLDYEVPGIAEAMRADGRRSTPFAALSRGLVGVRGGSLVVNVPGSPRGALESFEVVVPLLDHALETLAGPFDHAAARAGGRADLPAGRARERLRCSRPSRTSRSIRWCSRCSGAPRRSSPWRWRATCGCSRPPATRARPTTRPRACGARSATGSSRRGCSGTWRAGVLHAGIFWGFVLLTIGTANIVTGGLIEAVVSIPFDGALWVAVSAMQNVVAVIVLVVDRLGVLAAPRDEAQAPHVQPRRAR